MPTEERVVGAGVCVALRLTATGVAHDRPTRCAPSARRLKQGAENLQAHGHQSETRAGCPLLESRPQQLPCVHPKSGTHLTESCPNTAVPVNASAGGLLETPSSGCSSERAAPQQRRRHHNTDRISEHNHGLRPTPPTGLQHTHILECNSKPKTA